MNNADEVLGKMAGLVIANTKTTGILGARAMVLGKFFEAVLPHVTTSQRAETTRSFRQGIEDVMSLMDDVVLPAEYHSELLELTNATLAALNREPTMRE